MTKIKYQDSLVAFIDVLGFSNLVYDDDQSKIEKYFDYVLSDFKESLPSKGFKYILISDSIVISCQKTHKNLAELIFFLGKIQSQLFSKGILLRGAVSFGEVYINKLNNIIVGAGLINAFKLEKQAIFPRIIVDRKFILEFNTSTKLFIDSLNTTFKERYGEEDENIKLEKDGFLYINYARKFTRQGPTLRNGNLPIVITLFKKHYYSHTYFEKYSWLLNKLLEEQLTDKQTN